MTVPYLGCCCDEPVDGCGNTCFASSYAVAGLSGQYFLSRTYTQTEACICAGGDDPGVYWDLELDVEWTQLGTLTFTRYNLSGGGGGGGCCYYGEGTVTVTVQAVLRQYLYDCQSQSYVCQSEEEFGRSVDVPCCLTAVCDSGTHDECNRSFNGTHWLVSLSICDFAVAGSVEIMSDNRPNRPRCILTPQGFVCGGAVVQWRAPLKAFPSIFRNEVGQRSLFPDDALCEANVVQEVDAPTNCMDIVAANQAANGPFALYVVDEFSIGQDEPDPCTLALASTPYGAANLFGVGCDGATWSDPPCWGLECNFTCEDVTQSGGASWPTIT